MKYPLSIVNKLLDVYGGDVCVGYDIACSFMKTLKSSSLGPKAVDTRLRCVVPAFHGYAHSRSCQVEWHPLHVGGTGKEDFEGSERAFSASNSLAIGTRLSSRFHRAQAIQQHWLFWSMDKHAQSGKSSDFLTLRPSHTFQDYSYSTTTNKFQPLSEKPRQRSLCITTKPVIPQLTSTVSSSRSESI